MLSLVLVLLVISAGLLYLGLFYYSPSVSLSTFEVEVIEIINHTNGSTTNGLVYVASTNAEQVQGFQNAQTFGNCNGFSKNKSTSCLGMIFVTTNTQNLCFWMHDTPLPLEQVWILSNGTVAYIYQAQPESLKTVCQTAMDVLETNLSVSISVGDRIILRGITH